MNRAYLLILAIAFSGIFSGVFAQEEDEQPCGYYPFKSITEEKQFPYDNFFFQRSYPDYGNILPAFEHAKQIAVARLHDVSRSHNFNLQWNLEGPINVGGRVNVVTIDPTDSNIMFAGTANGGIYKTTDGGNNWASVVDTLYYFSVGDIKIDPVNHNIIYAGLGDPNISGYPAIGNGILKSLDGGATWNNIGLSETRIISKIEIHPLNHNIVYAAAMGLPYERDSLRGLYKSEDAGNTWRQVLFVSDSAGVIDLLLDNTDTNIVYAVSWNRIRQNLYGLIGGPDGKLSATALWTLAQTPNSAQSTIRLKTQGEHTTPPQCTTSTTTQQSSSTTLTLAALTRNTTSTAHSWHQETTALTTSIRTSLSLSI